MNLRVGPYVYRVEYVPDYIEHEGRACLGLCDNERHVLYVAAVASEAQQIQVLCHEYMEAWLYHFGPDLPQRAKERLCDVCGLAMTQFALDFVHQFRDLPEAAEPTAAAQAAMCESVLPAQTDPTRRWTVRVFEPAAS